jgi:hypothetical protein
LNLRSFHAFVILMSAALAALFGVWCLRLPSGEGGAASLVSGVASLAISAGLVAYDSWFLRRTMALR